MGKKNKIRSGPSHEGRPKKKQRKQGGYWINTCRESQPKEGNKASITVLISQSDLVDDHSHVAQENGDSVAKEEVSVTEKEKVEPEIPETTKKDEAPKDAVVVDEPERAVPKNDAHGSNAKVEDYSHAFISVKRMPSASGSPKVVRSLTFDPNYYARFTFTSHSHLFVVVQ